MARIDYVEASVLSDALGLLEQEVERGRRPWEEYEGDATADDDPASEAAYRAAMDACREALMLVIEGAVLVEAT